jgi:HlyD family secretion protein
MASRTSIRIVALGLIVAAAGAGGYWLSRPEPTPPIVGVVRATEVRIAPEVAGQLAAIKVRKGDHVKAGEVVAELSAIELTASVGQARAALAAATADRNNVYAGVRAEQVASLKAEIAKAKSRLEYAEQQLSRTDTLARSDNASQQALDQAQNDTASARADVAEAKANYDAAVAGPTKEERAIADAQVKAAASALAVLERHLDKTVLRAPADGVVNVIVADFWTLSPRELLVRDFVRQNADISVPAEAPVPKGLQVRWGDTLSRVEDAREGRQVVAARPGSLAYWIFCDGDVVPFD